MADNSQHVQHLLGQIDSSMVELEELQQSYDERKKSILGQVESYVFKLATLADTQAVRAMLLRQLYWETDISTELLARAFGLTTHRLNVIAGPLIIEKPCEGDCGVTLNKTYRSRSAIAEAERYKRRRDAGRDYRVWRFKDLCDSCAAREEKADAARSAQIQKARKERYEYLVKLRWDEFVETDEWIYVRNSLLHTTAYCCEICRNGNCTLYIYPHKDTPQYRLGGYKYSDTIFVLCRDCVSRCGDLITEGRRDVIRIELKTMIADNHSQGKFGGNH